MAPARKRTTNMARRRLDDEDETKSVATDGADDSQSDGSAPSLAEGDADADNSDLSDADSAIAPAEGQPRRKPHRARRSKPAAPVSARARSPPVARSDAAYAAPDAASVEELDFETAPAEPAPPVARPETLGDRRRREHDEYKKKRDSDPAFIPNRGAFFMHDSRSAPGQNGFRPVGARGRGRGAIGGPFSPANLRHHPQEATDSPWQHDLHDAVNAPHQPAAPAPPAAAALHTQQPPHPSQHQPHRAPFAPASKPPPARNFSTTVHTHNAVVRVLLPNMKSPITFQNVPIKSHTRLPNHRPPLRRDKPVRISLPPSAPRYIFPTVERSFIFIPRALRPNQQGFGRGRGRFGSIGGGGGGFSSRRTSVYGGSVYSPSVALSRRSSIARDNMVSPAGSIMSRNGSFIDPSRPVVRLPPGGVRMPTGPAIISPTNGSYPPPQKPAFRENWAQGQLPMHQPRPQKNVNVAGIESPASMHFNPPQQQEQQPFHQQVPAHINGAASGDQAGFYQHARQPSYPGHVSTGTPLSNIPERAIHAPAFQPFQPGYQPQPFVPGGYYYPPSGSQLQFMAPGGMVPMFVPGAQQPYPMPPPAPAVAPPAPPAAGPPNMVAYEQNGMTYYVDSNQLPYAPPAETFGQPSYAVPGMGGMMTPGPDGAYYYPQQMQPAAFYPQQ
ncbi:CASC3/Barentsz eIF4AIII binding-domain-containing protein [Boeremia exigua]|uniref:CASC3/Barentsz eIF4AIII binding-domain-containing protein n=1 Tax=Boeremia exigua TaxID=749465 RepID=UPI001E8E8F13|nr:CASC3/Barentsz eIF4AIII binding-domain-containing protein [Boeremia exigua]KAH6633008.1 CASC3/Barentsz eIF4AIII binding-domain-containing protein [Boeremia exigua]